MRILKAISDENRLRIIKLLEQKELCVCEMQNILSISQPAVSHHLKVLYDAGLIDYSKDGLFVNYKLSEEESQEAASVKKVLLASLKEKKIVREDLKKLKSVDREEIVGRQR